MPSQTTSSRPLGRDPLFADESDDHDYRPCPGCRIYPTQRWASWATAHDRNGRPAGHASSVGRIFSCRAGFSPIAKTGFCSARRDRDRWSPARPRAQQWGPSACISTSLVQHLGIRYAELARSAAASSDSCGAAGCGSSRRATERAPESVGAQPRIGARHCASTRARGHAAHASRRNAVADRRASPSRLARAMQVSITTAGSRPRRRVRRPASCSSRPARRRCRRIARRARTVAMTGNWRIAITPARGCASQAGGRIGGMTG